MSSFASLTCPTLRPALGRIPTPQSRATPTRQAKPSRLRSARSALRMLAVLFMPLLAAGCDALDPAALMSELLSSEATREAQTGQTGNDATPPSASPEAAAPGMASVGPEGAMRIYYQFTDDRGRVQFVERLSDVPEAWRERVGYVEMNQPPPLTPAAARRTWKLSAEQSAQIKLAANTTSGTTAPGQRGPVVLYAANWCGYCRMARAHLDRAGIDYEVRDVDNGAIARELKAKTGRGGIPVLDFEGEILRGYSADQYERIIRVIQS